MTEAFLIFLVGALALAVWAIAVEPRLLRVRDLELRSAKWPARMPPLRIAMMADLHIGAPHATLARLRNLVDQVNGAEPDVILLPGDFVQGVLFGRTIQPEPIAEQLGRLSAQYGAFAVLGNHDWSTDGRRMWRALEKVGITVLENKAAPVQLPQGRIWIAGFADDSTRSPDPVGVVGRLPARDPVIAMTHDPAVFPDIPARVVVTFAGHTHGGQVCLPFVGALTNASRAPLRHSYGLVEDGGKQMYVTSGIGTSMLPIRFNMPPEIVVFTVQSADDAGRAAATESREPVLAAD